MKTIRNKTHRPIRVPLPGGKVLHLGPAKEGQISGSAEEHPGVKKLVEAGTIEVFGVGSADQPTATTGGRAHGETHGHHPQTSVRSKGDR